MKAQALYAERLNRYQKTDFENVAIEFCEAWGFEFVGLTKTRGSHYIAEIKDSECLEFVRCTCGEINAMFGYDNNAMGSCKCGEGWDGSEVQW